MDNSKDDKHDLGGNFECSSCRLNEKFDYKGIKPPFARNILFLEECYVMKDPFSLPNRGEVLVIGGDCSICNNPICSNCSIFYGKRFCNECSTKNLDKFPAQLKTKIININNKNTN